jgi:hypothetical protein
VVQRPLNGTNKATLKSRFVFPVHDLGDGASCVFLAKPADFFVFPEDVSVS